jgi:hypothetical protein
VRTALDGYTDLMAAALSPYSGHTAAALRLRCVAVLGAAEAIATELTRERLTLADAVATLTDLILAFVVGGAGSVKTRPLRTR